MFLAYLSNRERLAAIIPGLPGAEFQCLPTADNLQVNVSDINLVSLGRFEYIQVLVFLTIYFIAA